MMLPVIAPRWNAPSNVVAFTTTVDGGVSVGSYQSFNLGTHVGDNLDAVAHNRLLLQQFVGNKANLHWLNQTHSDIIVNLDMLSNDMVAECGEYSECSEGDASFTSQKHNACIVMTADCLPVLLCNRSGTKVAALHCGWQGLAKNLIQKAINVYFSNSGKEMNNEGDDAVIAWLGPAIAQSSYEVDEKLYQRFVSLDKAYQSAFVASRSGHYLMSLYDIARQQLQTVGVPSNNIFGGDYDTLTDERFFSHRRSCQQGSKEDYGKTGRIASVIYLR